MTWIVGAPTLFGHAILISDICVTFRDDAGTSDSIDCLQKIYPVGKSQLAGFSGSVSLGFKMIHQLIYESSKLDDNQDWIIDLIANTWLPRLMRRIFNNSSEQEKKLGCTIILASAHPYKNMGDVSWPITNCHVFRGPDFSPKAYETGEIVSIGSGSNIDVYESAMKAVIEDSGFRQTIVGGPGMQGVYLARAITKAVEEHPTKGVSKLFQIGIITRNGFIIRNNEYKIFPNDGPVIEVKFPKIATNYNEFQEYCKGREKLAESASC